MSTQEPITTAESEALHDLGHFWLDSAGNLLGVAEVDAAVLQAYRAGFAAGRKPPEPRVFREGDPEPGPEVVALLDRDDDVWTRGDPKPWVVLMTLGPMVACPPETDWYAATDADEQRRGGGQ